MIQLTCSLMWNFNDDSIFLEGRRMKRVEQQTKHMILKLYCANFRAKYLLLD